MSDDLSATLPDPAGRDLGAGAGAGADAGTGADAGAGAGTGAGAGAGRAFGADPVFEENRRYLGSVAYRLLGSFTDAEDVLQEAWLRWRAAAGREVVADPRAYLSTIVTRLCYDQLGSARARREAYVGEWLPEPSVAYEDAPRSPDELAERGESVSLALLAVMEQLTPAERAAFVLHDVFAVGFEEIAATLERTPEATRKLASRARRRVREGGGRRATADPAEHRQAVEAFAAATARGDILGLMEVLDPEVVWHADGGGIVRAAIRPVRGADRVARTVIGILAKRAALGSHSRPVLVNGRPGLLWHDAAGAVTGVMDFTVSEGRITDAYVIANPEKLRRITVTGV